MALQVWFPLTGNLENKGLCNITATNSGATVNSAGKIGKCYSFDKTLLQRLNLSGITDLVDIVKEHDFSVCAWLKTTENGCWLSITYSYRFWSNMIYVPYNNFTSLGSKVIDGKWHHLCYTHSHTTLKNSCYIDGLEVYSNVGTAAATTTYKNAASIGNDVNNSSAVNNHFNGDINDVRIYDHCLSAKEVHEIAQGLILHLPLRDPYVESTTNLLGTKSDDFSGWSSYGFGGKGVKSIPTDVSPAITGQVCRVTSNGNNSNQSIEMATGTSGPSLAKNETITVSAYVKGEGNSIGKTGRLHVYNTNGTNTQSTGAVNFTFTGEWQRVSGTYTWGYDNASGTSFNLYVVGYINNGESYLFSNAQIEVKDHVTPWTEGTRVQGSVYDCSGYGHHATPMTTLTPNTDTPRYDISTKNTADYPLKVIMTFPTSTGLTIACWVKLTAWGTQTSGLWATSSNSTTNPSDYTTTTCNHRDGGWDIKGVNTSVKRLTCDATDIPLNTWKHVVFVHDGTNVSLYINGVYVRQVALADSLVGFQALFLGYSLAGGANRRCQGSWSDFRLYATALSATDIRELYDTAASIDNLGGVHSYQFVEETIGRGRVKQTGQVVSDEFVEKLECLYLPAGSCVVSCGPTYANGDVCKAITKIRYETGGSTRDLMGFSARGRGYWGVTAASAWEDNTSSTFIHTETDITVLNTVTYQYTATSSVTGTYSVGCIGGTTSWATRGKYIYDVKLWKNNVLERHLIPAKTAAGVGLYDTITKTFYPTNTGGSISADGTTAKIYDTYIETSQLLEK